MTKFTLLIFLSFLLLNFDSSAMRSMYVNDFASILGDVSAEDELLSYSQSNGIETLLLYDLHVVNANFPLSDPNTNTILADFISKAKTNYGILKIGAVAENGWFFTHVINTYNNSRTNPAEKFDIYSLEFEFWLQSATDPGGYYCDTYLVPNGLPCTNDGAFQFFISTLQTMRNLAATNTHPISTEAYVGWPTASQSDSIADYVDQLRVHAYVTDPTSAFPNSESRLADFANGFPGLDVSIIFSSEPTFMQSWLTSFSMNAAETIYTNDWQSETSTWTNNINLLGFTYFAYSFSTNVTLATDDLPLGEQITTYPNPVHTSLTINNPESVELLQLYDNLGKLILETKANQLDFNQLAQGIYSLRISTNQGMEVKKIVKQ